MFKIKIGKIRAGGVINGEEIVVRTLEQTNNTSDKIKVNYNAWASSQYNKETDNILFKAKAPRISLTDVPAEIIEYFNTATQVPDWKLGNEILINWLKTNLGLLDGDIIIEKTAL